MILLLGFAFLSGLATILAPCIWPVLPIVLSSSLSGKGHNRALGITLGVMISFMVITLFISELVLVFHIDSNILRFLAVILIGFLGLSLLIPKLAYGMEYVIGRFASIFGLGLNKQGSDFLPGFITGLSLGVVWSPCAGPILATIAVLSATGRVNLEVIALTACYVFGAGIPLFAFAYGSKRLVAGLKGISRFTSVIQQIFGFLVILMAVAILTNFDKTLQLKLLSVFPQLGAVSNGFENNSYVREQLDNLKGSKSVVSEDNSGLFNENTPAPDFTGVVKWLNEDSGRQLSIYDLKGKVVLVDFWTYTCINCIRTLPYVTSWYDRYKDQGFVVIGVHTPEFEFEKDTGNVLNAIKQFNIHYPVAQDNNYVTWNNYGNQYWPAEYLIDSKGNIRRTHFGEGEYDTMEKAIVALLKESGKTVNRGLSQAVSQNLNTNISPETYLGSKRMQYYYPSGTLPNGIQNFTLSDNLGLNSFSFGGMWTVSNENAVSGVLSTLNYNFLASKVYVILRPGGDTPGKVKVFLDGKVIDKSSQGGDVNEGFITVDSDRLYNVVDLHGRVENHILKLEFENVVQAYTFTFG